MTHRLGIQRFDPNLSSQAKTFREDFEYTFFPSGLCFLHSIISICWSDDDDDADGRYL